MAANPTTPAPFMPHGVQADTPPKGFHPGNHHFEEVAPVALETAFEGVADPVNPIVNQEMKDGYTTPFNPIPKGKTPAAPKKRHADYHGGHGNAPAAIQLFPDN